MGIVASLFIFAAIEFPKLLLSNNDTCNIATSSAHPGVDSSATGVLSISWTFAIVNFENLLFANRFPWPFITRDNRASKARLKEQLRSRLTFLSASKMKIEP